MLTKLRPAMLPLVVTTLKQWTPAALAGLPAASVKSVEKSVRILLQHLARYVCFVLEGCSFLILRRAPNNGPYATQINEALTQQSIRMEKAATDEKARKASASTAIGDNRKRPISAPAPGEPPETKRPKLESNAAASTSAAFLATFDFTTLPANLITELIVANLEAFTEPALITLVQTFRESRGLAAPSVAAPGPTAPKAIPPHIEKDLRNGERPLTPQGRQVTPVALSTPPSKVKDEPVDPLQMDIDQDELEYEPDKLNQEVRKNYVKIESDSNMHFELPSFRAILDWHHRRWKSMQQLSIYNW
jgi:symplekin